MSSGLIGLASQCKIQRLKGCEKDKPASYLNRHSFIGIGATSASLQC
jgi:hypothetical protein